MAARSPALAVVSLKTTNHHAREGVSEVLHLQRVQQNNDPNRQRKLPLRANAIWPKNNDYAAGLGEFRPQTDTESPPGVWAMRPR